MLKYVKKITKIRRGRKLIRNIIILVLFCLIILFIKAVYAWPSWGGTKDTGYPINNSEVRDVIHGSGDLCNKVTNNSGKNIFVPTKTDEEWNNFANHKPNGVSIETCCTSHDHFGCYNNDVYWYDSCNNREEKAQECGTSGYIGSNFCKDDSVYRKYVHRGCSGGSCYQWTSDNLIQYCPWHGAWGPPRCIGPFRERCRQETHCISPGQCHTARRCELFEICEGPDYICKNGYCVPTSP